MDTSEAIAYFVSVKDAWIYPGITDQELTILASKFYLSFAKLRSLI
jgi:hypothetical protein